MAGSFLYNRGSDFTLASAVTLNGPGSTPLSELLSSTEALNAGIGFYIGLGAVTFGAVYSTPSASAGSFLTIPDGSIATTGGGFLLDASEFTATVRLAGGTFGDSILGGSANDFLHGGGGLNTTIAGGSARDTLRGGAGDDRLTIFGSADVLDGGEGTDTLALVSSVGLYVVNLRDGTFIGADGAAAVVFTSIENVTFLGAGGTLVAGATANRIEAQSFSTVSVSYAFSAAGVTIASDGAAGTGGDAEGDILVSVDTIIGSAFADALGGDGQANRLEGGDGADTLAGFAGADRLEGGDGLDLADYRASAAGIILDLALGAGAEGDAAGDTLVSIEAALGSGFDDEMSGNGLANRLAGGAGADLLSGRGGDDTLDGETGEDTVLGGTGADRLSGGAGEDVLNGGGGDDTLQGGADADLLNGGAGLDTVSYADASSGIAARLGAGGTRGDAAGDRFVSVEALLGSGFRDTLSGSAAAETISGDGGDDVIAGLAGADDLRGGAGADMLDYRASASAVLVNLELGIGFFGDAAGDSLTGFEGVLGSAGNDTVVGAGTADRLAGGDGADALDGAGGTDTVTGGAGNDVASGAAGEDRLYGELGDDALLGGVDRDTLDGGEGDDFLVGGEGADRLTGGLGADIFRWNVMGDSTRAARDVVFDFDAAEGDLLDLGAFGAAYAGNGAFLGGTPSVTWRALGADTELRLDADGDGAVDLSVILRGVASLSASDFILSEGSA